MNRSTQWIGLIAGILICFAAAGLGSLATTPQIPNWYADLAKPSWTPPDWIFGPVWALLHLMMAVSAWLMWRQAGFKLKAQEPPKRTSRSRKRKS